MRLSLAGGSARVKTAGGTNGADGHGASGAPDAAAVRTRARMAAVRHGLVLTGLIIAAWMYLVVGDRTWANPGSDGLIYWAVDPANPYAGSFVGGAGAYLYSPAFAQAFWLIGRLPREVFVVGWTVLLAVVALWLARPWPATLLVLALPVSQEILIGNIHLLLAAAIVLGFRWPATWAFVLLTKVTPGVGLLWFAVRREWRALAIALVATGVVIAVSLVVGGLQPWLDWIALLRRDGGAESWRLYVRVAIAAILVIWGARTDRRWTVPLAALIALPVIWSDSFAMLLGCVALSRRPAPAPALGSPSVPPATPTPSPGPDPQAA
jgi:hypothetical protein